MANLIIENEPIASKFFLDFIIISILGCDGSEAEYSEILCRLCFEKPRDDRRAILVLTRITLDDRVACAGLPREATPDILDNVWGKIY